MQFLSIDIENFCSIAHIQYEMEKEGLVIVEGDNRDIESATSNGAGKSTAIVDALCWCLFGVTAKKTATDQVLPQGKGKGTRVALTMKLDDGKTIVVTRHRKHPEGNNSLRVTTDGVDVSRATTPDTEKLLKQLLRVDQDTFLYTTVLGQGLSHRFSVLTDQGRKEILEAIAGVGVYEAARIRARECAKDAKSRLDRAEGEIMSLTQALESVRRQVQQAEQQRDSVAATIESKRVELQSKKTAAEQQKQYLETVQMPNTDAQEAQQAAFSRAETLAFNQWREKVALNQEALVYWNHARKHAEELGKIHTDVPCYACGTMVTGPALEAEKARRNGIATDAHAKIAPAEAEELAIKQRYDAVVVKLNELREQVTAAKSRRTVIAANISQVTSTISHCDAQLVQLQASRDPHDADVAAAQKRLEETEASYLSANEKVAMLTQEHGVYEWWQTGFNQIRVKAIDVTLGFLNSRIKNYCQTLTDGEVQAFLLYDDKGKLNLTITTHGGTYASASGGEKTRADLAIAFALHDLASSRADFSSNILILDEVASELDSAGIERLMRLVADKLDRVSTCFFISHNPIFRAYADKTWVIVKSGGISSLSVT